VVDVRPPRQRQPTYYSFFYSPGYRRWARISFVGRRTLIPETGRGRSWARAALARTGISLPGLARSLRKTATAGPIREAEGPCWETTPGGSAAPSNGSAPTYGSRFSRDGRLFCKPAPPDAFEALLRARPPLSSAVTAPPSWRALNPLGTETRARPEPVGRRGRFLEANAFLEEK